MSKQGIKLTQEEISNIQEMLDEGLSGEQIGIKMKRSKNCIYWNIKKYNLRPLVEAKRPGKRKVEDYSVPFSELPNDVLFDYRKFPAF